MGMFGETPEERELKDQLDEKEAELATVQEGLDSTRKLLVQQANELNRERTKGIITEVAERALADAEKSGDVQIGAADTAQAVVKARYIGQAEAVIADKIIDGQADAIRMKRGPEWDKEVEERLREQYERDGTLDAIERETDAIDIGVIAQRIKDETAAERKAFNESEDRQRELHDNARAKLEADGELQRIRDEKDEEAESIWHQKALDEAVDEIDTEVTAGERDYKDRVKREWRESHDGQQHIDYRRRMLERDWEKTAIEEIAKKIDDEELTALLASKAERAKEQLRKEEFYANYLESFTHTGVDMTTIPEDTQVTVELGTVVDKMKSDGYGGQSKTGRKTVNAERTLRLTSLGGGKYRLESDSLHGSKNVYEKQSAIPVGQTIHLGRKTHETVNGNKATSLDESLRHDVTLFYDDDRSDPNITSSHLPVANVRLNGMSALKNLEEDYTKK